MTKLDSSAQKFIIHWGEMGERWGINRTVAQIQALLYIASQPLNAEQISQTLAVARSTVSAGLRELLGWGIIRVVHVLGDRTDYFEVVGDVWEMFRLIIDRRKHIELDPTLEMLRQVVGELEDRPEQEVEHEKLAAMLDFFETVSGVYDQGQKVPTRTIVRVAKMADVVRKVLGLFPE